jgi:hypothetical protein
MFEERGPTNVFHAGDQGGAEFVGGVVRSKGESLLNERVAVGVADQTLHLSRVFGEWRVVVPADLPERVGNKGRIQVGQGVGSS